MLTDHEDSDSEEEDGGLPLSDQSEEEEEDLPVYLWRPQTTDAMGEWEKHTKVQTTLILQ